MSTTDSEPRMCRCGYPILVYVISYEYDKPSQYRYFDGLSGNYEQTYICPGCQDRLDYITLGGV